MREHSLNLNWESRAIVVLTRLLQVGLEACVVDAPVYGGLGGGGRGRNVGEASQGTCGMRRAGEATGLTSRLYQ